MCRQAISSGGFSHDLQVSDVMSFFESSDSNTYNLLVGEFLEFPTLVWSGAWVDTDASDVDPDYMAWLCDAIENMTSVYWEDGEPWLGDDRSCGNDHLLVCPDCLIVSVNHDPSGIDDPDRERAVWSGIARYVFMSGRDLVPGDYSEGSFSWSSCDLCGDRHGGTRYEMVGI